MPEKSTRGGARPGAGRPSGQHGTKAPITLSLTPDVLAWLETLGTSRSDHVDNALRKTAAFRRWLAER